MNEFTPSYYKPKKGIFGYSLLNEQNEKLDKKIIKKLGIKFNEEGDKKLNKKLIKKHENSIIQPVINIKFSLNINGKETKACKYLCQYTENQIMLYTEDKHFFNINLDNGVISPEFSSCSPSTGLYISEDKILYTMDDEGNAVDTGFRVPERQLTQTYNGYLRVANTDGKQGLIDKDLNEFCPLIFDHENFNCSYIDENKNLRRIVDSKNNKLYVLNKEGKFLIEKDFKIVDTCKHSSEFTKVGENCFFLKNENGENILYEYNAQNDSLDQLTTTTEIVPAVYRLDNEVYLNLANHTLMRLSDKEKILEGCEEINFNKIDNQPMFSFKKHGFHKNYATMGIYSVNESKEILSPDKMITSINFDLSAKMKDGSYRLFCKSTIDKSMFNIINNHWGVVDNSGKTLLDFNYDYEFVNKKVQNEKGKSEIVKTPILKDKYKSKYNFNIREDNIIEFIKEKKQRNGYSNDYDFTRPIVKSISEDEKLANAALVSIIYGSPIAGMFYYNSLDDNENEM